MPTNPKEVQLDISFASRLNALKKPWHVPQGVHHLMVVLELYAGPTRDFCWPSLKTLAGVMNVTERQVRRLIAQAVQLELLFEIVDTQDGRKTRRFKIRQANMIERARRIEREKPERPRRRRRRRSPRAETSDKVSRLSDTLSQSTDKVSLTSDTMSRISDTLSVPSDTLSDVSDKVSQPDCLYEFESTKKVQIESSPPPPKADADEWEEVRKAVVKFPIRFWRTAVDAARSAGCSPAQVRAIVAEANRRRDDWDSPSGVLYQRLLHAHPSEGPGDGWPAPDAAAVARWRAAAEVSQRATIDAEESARKAQREAERRRWDELEEAFGLDLDTMPDDERNELVRAAIGANRIVWGAWVRDPDISAEIFRGPVLRYMAKQEEVTVTDEPA